MNNSTEILKNVWQEVLGRDTVLEQDDFFDLGGDSFSAIRASLLAQKKGLNINVDQILTHRNIKTIISTINEKNIKDTNNKKISVELSPIQHWFFSQQFDKSSHFNQAILLETLVQFDFEALYSSVKELIKNNPILRTAFKNGKPKQLACHNSDYNYCEEIVIEDNFITNCSDESKSLTLFKQANCSIDIESGNLLKILLINTKSGRQFIYITIHHLVMDFYSWNLFIEGLVDDQKTQLPMQENFYSEWCKILKRYAKSKEITAEKSYWYNQITINRMLPVHQKLLTDNIKTDSRHKFSINSDNIPSEPAKAQVLLIAAYIYALSKLFSTSEIILNLESHGRYSLFDINVSSIIGWFTSLYPVKFTVPNNGHREQLVKNVDKCLAVVPKLGIGYGVSKYLTNDAMLNTQNSGITDKMFRFNYLGKIENINQYNNKKLKFVDFDTINTVSKDNLQNYIVDLQAYSRGSKHTFIIHYSKDIVSLESIDQLSNTIIHFIDKQ